MAGKKSQNKGKEGEREIVRLLQPCIDRAYNKAGIPNEAPKLQRNTLQSDSGGYDIVGIDWMALEIKRCETLSIPAWWRQTTAQAGPNQMPILIYRQSRQPWRVKMRVYLADDAGTYLAKEAIVAIEDFCEFFEAKVHADLARPDEGPGRCL